jgi:hypothetical protein
MYQQAIGAINLIQEQIKMVLVEEALAKAKAEKEAQEKAEAEAKAAAEAKPVEQPGENNAIEEGQQQSSDPVEC